MVSVFGQRWIQRDGLTESDLLVRVDLSVAFIRKTFVIPDKPPSAEPGKPNYNCHRQ